MHGDVSSLLDPRERKRRVLLLDYDGTLVPFTATPSLAVPDVTLLSLLHELSSRDDTHVHVVSGRCRHTLDSWLGHLPIGLHAEHGYWSKPHADTSWTARFADDHRPWMERALGVMAAPVTCSRRCPRGGLPSPRRRTREGGSSVART